MLESFRILLIILLAVNAAQSKADDNRALMKVLVESYPDFLVGYDDKHIIWKDGSRSLFDDGRSKSGFEELLNKASLRDMFYVKYPLGELTNPPSLNNDPGRVRNEEFFLKMYGDCRDGEVEKKMVSITWLPKKYGKKLRVTNINGVAKKLQEVSVELDALPSRFDEYLFPPAGTYNCRMIAGTKRMSNHGTASAIDISTKHGDYWKNSKPDKNGNYVRKNRIPYEIVRIFEKHGFIWGGKWYHYDTFHFEYRPEILNMSAEK